MQMGEASNDAWYSQWESQQWPGKTIQGEVQRIKTKPQKEMSQQQKLNVIQAMLTKSGLMVGVRPITMEHIKCVEKY